jgi:hypothetical protein
MTVLKGLTVLIALLAGGTSLALAQNGPSTAGQPPMTDGSADSRAAPGPASHHHGTKRHRMYMMTVNRTSKGSKLTPASQAKPQMKQ